MTKDFEKRFRAAMDAAEKDAQLSFENRAELRLQALLQEPDPIKRWDGLRKLRDDCFGVDYG